MFYIKYINLNFDIRVIKGVYYTFFIFYEEINFLVVHDTRYCEYKVMLQKLRQLYP